MLNNNGLVASALGHGWLIIKFVRQFTRQFPDSEIHISRNAHKNEPTGDLGIVMTRDARNELFREELEKKEDYNLFNPHLREACKGGVLEENGSWEMFYVGTTQTRFKKSQIDSDGDTEEWEEEKHDLFKVKYWLYEDVKIEEAIKKLHPTIEILFHNKYEKYLTPIFYTDDPYFDAMLGLD